MKVDEQWENRAQCAIKTEGTYRGGGGTTPETTACPDVLESKSDVDTRSCPLDRTASLSL